MLGVVVRTHIRKRVPESVCVCMAVEIVEMLELSKGVGGALESGLTDAEPQVDTEALAVPEGAGGSGLADANSLDVIEIEKAEIIVGVLEVENKSVALLVGDPVKVADADPEKLPTALSVPVSALEKVNMLVDTGLVEDEPVELSAEGATPVLAARISNPLSNVAAR